MARTRSETRARYFLRQEAALRGWNTSHVSRGGDLLEENEIVDHFPDIGLGLDRPDFLLCMSGAPVAVLETKNAAAMIDVAINEAIAYADTINATGRYTVPIAVGVAGQDDTGYRVIVNFLAGRRWVPLRAYGAELTNVPAPSEVERALAADDGTTQVAVPSSAEFIDAAIELSRVLRACKVEAPLRPKVIGSLVLAMSHGEIDAAPDQALGSVNDLVVAAIAKARDLIPDRKRQFADALRLSGADFNRLAPSLGRAVNVLRRLNVAAVMETDADFLGTFYEAFLRYGYDNNALGIVFTPRHITRFCVELTGATASDRVLDIACGTGGFLVAAFDRMMSRASSPRAVSKIKRSLHGFDTNPTVWALAMLNMFFRGDGKSNIVCASCFESEIKDSISERFTRAYLNPPFSQHNEPERDFIDAALEALEPDGILAAVVKAGIFADDDHKSWRRELSRRHSPLAVISLPEDLFYPTAAPTSIVVARAHRPLGPSDRVLMARVWNDGFEKLKNRRIAREGNQLPEVADAFARVRRGLVPSTSLATVVLGEQLVDGGELSPQEWLPQPVSTPAITEDLEREVIAAIVRAVALLDGLGDAILNDFGARWKAELPPLPLHESSAISTFFKVRNGRSRGERHYSDGGFPYVSSGDSSNSIIRLVDTDASEVFASGGITVTAFGQACVQPWPFVGRGNGGSAVRVLEPRFNMSVREMVWFAAQINAQRWRFPYSRMAIKSRLERLRVTSPEERLVDSHPSLAKRIARFQVAFSRASSFASTKGSE